MSERSLLKIFDVLSDSGIFEKKEIPSVIPDNLASFVNLRHYQNEALKRFLYFMEDYNNRPASSLHLLFHMATGSGKTVLMAALILHLYEKGYRNFLFFVNSANIIDKTKENFLNSISSKYLFADHLMLNGKNLNVREVMNFDESVDTDINIHFSTIQGLHTRIDKPRENAVTLEDFEDREIIFIADESHHLNALTKNSLSKSDEAEKASWENTVECIFRSNPNNLLLEFTATADLKHPAICEKYHDKTLYDYSLRQFREDGYSKDVELRQADLLPADRMFQAVLLSQYRRKIAEKYRSPIKPVILMKSKTINESKENQKMFSAYLENLEPGDLKKLHQNSNSIEDKTIHKAVGYFFNEKGINYGNFIQELRQDFSPEKIINVNSSDDLQRRQIDLNNLESDKNEVRVVFAVDKLNEGWDVLNLFDIVRLYDTRDSQANKPGKTTIAEAQLIGRGARYCPFIPPDQPEMPREKRKYDQRMDHDLRILEELHYHCSHNPKYIQEIKAALCATGIMGLEPRKVTLKVKDEFKKSTFYQNQHIYLNERRDNKREGISELKDYIENMSFIYPRPLMTGRSEEESVFTNNLELAPQNGELKREKYSLTSFGTPVLRRAIDMVGFFRFGEINRYFPALETMKCFMELEAFLGSIEVEVQGLREHLDSLSPDQKLDITLFTLNKIERAIRTESTDHIGTKIFDPVPIKCRVTDYTISVDQSKESGLPYNESRVVGLKKINFFESEWHVYDNAYGNSYEKEFISFISQMADQIRKRFDEFYLIRNEKHFQVYNFDDGQPFEPDFALFLKEKQSTESAIYQLFVEPKGEHLEEGERWKEIFLLSLKKKVKLITVFDGPKYRIMGMPFFQREGQRRAKFSKAFEALLEDAS